MKKHKVRPDETFVGKVTYYPDKLDGHEMTDGDRFHQKNHTAASNRLPLGTKAKVTNLKNGKSTEGRLANHGPALGDRRIDLSKKALTTSE